VLAKPGDRLPAGAAVLKLDLAESGMSVAELQQKRVGQQDQLTRLKATTRLIDTILANPDNALQGTSAWANTFLGRDHLARRDHEAAGGLDGS